MKPPCGVTVKVTVPVPPDEMDMDEVEVVVPTIGRVMFSVTAVEVAALKLVVPA